MSVYNKLKYRVPAHSVGWVLPNPGSLVQGRGNDSNRARCSIPILNTPWLETTRSPIIPPTQPTTPIQCTSKHLILNDLPLLSKDHDSTEIQTTQAKLNENLENGPLNAETLMLAMDLMITVFHEESLQHLITKKPDCITVIKGNQSLDHGARQWNYTRKRRRA